MFIESYSDLDIRTPDCHVGSTQWVARCHLDRDVSELFPYINAVSEKAKYLDKPHYIQFLLDGYRCALYPDSAVASPFRDRTEALTFLDRLIGFLNDIFVRRESIEPNYKKYQPLPILEIFKLLPRNNCQACGDKTCLAFASTLSTDPALFERCPALLEPKDEDACRLRKLLLG